MLKQYLIKMEKNEIVINDVHHVLVDGSLTGCDGCSLKEICINSLKLKHDVLCHLIYEGICDGMHFEIKDKTMSKEEFNIVVQVMGLLRCGKISTLTPNCDVREILLAEKIK